MCATSRKIEPSVKPITFLSRIYFRGTRRGSDKVVIHGTGKLCDYDIVMGKVLRQDKALKWKNPHVAVKKVRGRFEYHIK